MGNTQILYTRRFSDLGALQEPHILQYALINDTDGALPYGVAITGLYAGRQETQSCRAISHSAEKACRLLLYLYENAVEPCAAAGVVENIRRSGAMA